MVRKRRFILISTSFIVLFLITVLFLIKNNYQKLQKTESRASGNIYQVEPSPTPNPLYVEHKLAVALVKLGNSAKYSEYEFNNMPSIIYNMLFTDDNSLNRYFQEISNGQIYFSGKVYGWYDLSNENFNCDYEKLDEVVRNLLQIDAPNDDVIFSSLYNHLIYVYAGIPECLKRGNESLGAAYPGLRVSWVYDPVNKLHTYIHEIGHNFWLDHADLDVRMKENKEIDFLPMIGFDPYDPMNFGDNIFHFNAPHKAALGIIPENQILTFDESYISNSPNGIFETEIIAHEINGAGIKIIRIPVLDNNMDKYYFFSFRKQTGFDNGLPASVTQGINIHTARYNAFNTLFLESFTLKDGESFQNKEIGYSVYQVSHTENSVKILISKKL